MLKRSTFEFTFVPIITIAFSPDKLPSDLSSRLLQSTNKNSTDYWVKIEICTTDGKIRKLVVISEIFVVYIFKWSALNAKIMFSVGIYSQSKVKNRITVNIISLITWYSVANNVLDEDNLKTYCSELIHVHLATILSCN